MANTCNFLWNIQNLAGLEYPGELLKLKVLEEASHFLHAKNIICDVFEEELI